MCNFKFSFQTSNIGYLPEILKEPRKIKLDIQISKALSSLVIHSFKFGGWVLTTKFPTKIPLTNSFRGSRVSPSSPTPGPAHPEGRFATPRCPSARWKPPRPGFPNVRGAARHEGCLLAKWKDHPSPPRRDPENSSSWKKNRRFPEQYGKKRDSPL